MTASVAWIDGQWGTAASLQLPLDDRALLLADGLFETVLIRNGEPQLLQELSLIHILTLPTSSWV